MTHAHETQTKKARCLHFHAGKRCGRVAKHEVSYLNGRRHHQSVCDRCLADIEARAQNVSIAQSNKKGFRIVSGGLSGAVSRNYIAII